MISFLRNYILVLLLYIDFSVSAEKGISISYGTDGQASAYSTFFYQDFKLNDPLDRIKLGYLIRFSNFSSNIDLFYTDSSSSEKSSANSIQIKSPNIYSLNGGFVGNIDFLSNLGFGFNLDLFGISFGGQKIVENSNVKANPAQYNLFLYNINDLGSLNSEFYIFYTHKEFILLRTGLSHYFSEYTTDVALANNSKKFRRVSNLFFLSIGLNF
ncbi:hypothetical protein [Fluviispira multicolorata]|uniref:Outer membrane protein beta-barrel domain-containing protein n=1 Tax=Fluviispira multicolorata TaxID=2654512 RepID=A0A833JGG8_9BACT|nr:hypothetical protein [Fluviispira multicolorata]KAB8032172.1 hypothetical protein GCL57_05875 [Fluviispira multicolorata]